MVQYVYPQQQQTRTRSRGPGFPGAGSLLSNLIGGGSSAGGSAAGASGAGAVGGGGFGSFMSSAGPWAALAAVIAANETDAIQDGRRRSGSDYWQDLATGEVLQQDMESWGFGEGANAFKRDAMFGVQLSQGDFGDAADTFKETTLGKLLRKIF